MYSAAGLSFGLCPCFGSVVSSALLTGFRVVSQGGVVLGKFHSP